jgi:hypothetical protein
MVTYIITYDLHNPGKNYENLLSEIRKFDYIKLGGSSYAIKTNQTAGQIMNVLISYLDNNDQLFVSRLTKSHANYGYRQTIMNWISLNIS